MPRLLFSIATILNLEVQQIDVKIETRGIYSSIYSQGNTRLFLSISKINQWF